MDHGPRLTTDEYESKIVALHTGLPPVPSKEQALRVRRSELELAIDHRLGRNFPKGRRDALWAVQRRVQRRRLRLICWYLLKRLFARGLARDAQVLASYLVDEYAKVLTGEELEAFFGREEAQDPMLPIEREER